MFGFLSGPFGCTGCAAAYRSTFCGLCNRLRMDYGLWARWLVNWDSSFLALLGSAQMREAPTTTHSTCCNPFSQARPLWQSDAPIHYAAAVTLCGLETKLADDAHDETGWRRKLASLAQSSLSGASGSAVELLHGMAFPVQQVRQALAEQHRLEAERRSLEEVAAPTARAYGEICAHTARISQCPQNESALRRLGEALGLLIYAEDAWVDLEKDRARGRFNPLLHGAEANADWATTVVRAWQRLQDNFLQLDLKRHRSLLSEILLHSSHTKLTPLLASQGSALPPLEQKKKEKDKSGRKLSRSDNCDCCHCCDLPLDFIRCSSPKSKSDCSLVDCNPCDGDGCECCGCECCSCSG